MYSHVDVAVSTHVFAWDLPGTLVAKRTKGAGLGCSHRLTKSCRLVQVPTDSQKHQDYRGKETSAQEEARAQ